MTRLLKMYDAAGENIARAPAGGDAYAGYLTDSIQSIANFAKVVELHYGHAHCVSIGIRESTLCALLDVEPGNPVRTPQGVRNSFELRKAHGVWRPGFYADQSDMRAIVIPGLAGIARHEYRLVVAVPGTNKIPPGFDGAQIEFAGTYDVSLLEPDFFPEPVPRRRRKRPRPVHRKVKGASAGGALGAGIIAILHAAHVHITAEEAAAISTIGAALAGYITPAKRAT